jgi:hypothetical protein
LAVKIEFRVSDALHERMKHFHGQADWGAIAARAVENAVLLMEDRQRQRDWEHKQSQEKAAPDAVSIQDAYAAGVEWARRHAARSDLKRLSDVRSQAHWTNLGANLTARIVLDRADAVWGSLHGVPVVPGGLSPQRGWLENFVQGALAVHDKT